MATAAGGDRPRLDGRDRERLRRALTTADDVRFFRRVAALRLVAAGHAVRDVARLLAVDPGSVSHWLRRYVRTRDIAALRDAPRAGRPRAAGAVTDARLRAVVRTDPRAVGFAAATWTVPLLATHLHRRYGVTIAPRTLRRRLHALDLRWKRPRYVYVEKDPHRAQKKGGSSVA